jgi:protein TonB
LHDFLFVRRVRGGDEEAAAFSDAGFGAGVTENLKELFRAGARGPVSGGPVSAGPVGLLSERRMAFAGFGQNLREAFTRQPRVAAGGEAAPEIWSKNTRFTRVQALSLAIHVVALALVIGPLLPMFMSPGNSKQAAPVTMVNLREYHFSAPPAAKAAGGGGGANDKAPVREGRTPKFAAMQLAALNSNAVVKPKVQMTPTLLGPEMTLPNNNMNTWGSALSTLADGGLGNGDGSGLGDGHGKGLGNGNDYGFGGSHPAGYGGYGSPKCVYCPNAEYSDDAVKAKYQGAVLVTALISTDGRVLDVRVVKGIGLGLDEKAVATVKTWRFMPAMGPDGRPAAVEQTIELDFRLI